MEFDLRLAASDQAPLLSRLMTQTFLAAYGDVAPPAAIARHIERHYDARDIARRIDAGVIEVHLLESAGQDAGYLQLGFGMAAPAALAGLRTLEVQRCYLRPEYIGTGAGGLLIERAQRRARETGAQALHLSVYQQAPRAVRFYEKHGFRRTAPVKYYIDDVVYDDWLMVWWA
ncbi:MAG: GNAT family N-acetyltransferase [Xanthomonadales bacterium PRO6]|nr:Spermidine/spermine N(1)-acetyltransferase [Xanthomonadales bacterium]MCE7930002.1 GNAT family N-acetyltransferase [Xanthomonadales bacterium PRO6]